MAETGLQALNAFLIFFPFLLSFSILAIRVWRRIIERQFSVEDILLVIAEALIAALSATVWKYVKVSYSGYHVEDIPKGAVNSVEVLRWRYINNAIYNPILGLVKISFLITLLKLRSQNRLIIASLWSLIVVNILFILAATFGSALMCWPVEKYWYPTLPGSCGNRAQYVFGVIGVTIGTDVLVTIIPAWILHDLQVPLKNKVAIIVFLSLPLTVTAIGCYRLYNFVVVFNLPTLSAEDPYNVRNALSNVESNLAVISACGPTLKWLLSRFIPYFDTSRATKVHSPKLSWPWLDFSNLNTQSDGHMELQDTGILRKIYRKKNNKDAESEEHIITNHSGNEIRKTTEMEREISDAHKTSRLPSFSNRQAHRF